MNGNERIRRTEVTPPCAEPYEDEVEVAVVGAGPVGLTAAAMLATYGIRTVVLDGADEPAGFRYRTELDILYVRNPGRAGPEPLPRRSRGSHKEVHQGLDSRE